MHSLHRALLPTVALLAVAAWYLPSWSAGTRDVQEVSTPGTRRGPELDGAPTRLVAGTRPEEPTRAQAVEAAGEAPPVATAAATASTLEGVLLLPEDFPTNAVATAQLWTYQESDMQLVRAETTFLAGDPWRFEHVPTGTWMVSVRAVGGGRTAWGASGKIELVGGVDPARVELAILEFAVEGRITDTSGRPIPGLSVLCTGLTPLQPRDLEQWESYVERNPFGSAKQGGGSQRFWDERSSVPYITAQATPLQEGAQTDAEGRFRIPMRTSGPVTLSAPGLQEEDRPGRATYQAVSRALHLTRTSPVATVELELTQSASVRGRLFLPAGLPAGGAEVFLREEAAGSRDTLATADGEFRFGGLGEGNYLLHARWTDDEGRPFHAYRWLEVAGGADLALDETLSPSSSANGRVVDEQGRGVQAQVEAKLQLVPDAAPLAGCITTADEEGFFTLTGLCAGEYILEVSVPELRSFFRAEGPAPGAWGELGVLVLRPHR